MMYLEQLAATTLIILAMLATSANCGILNYNQRILAEKSELMLDPTADIEYFKKVDDMTFVKPEFMKKLHHDEKRSKRLVKRNVNLWPNGVIPYAFSTSYNEEQEQEILRAMSHWEENTCIRFVERTTETSYLNIFKGAGCQSFIGNLGGSQSLSLTSGCIREFNLILHELGHAIGFLHEHTRPDRDEHVDIVYDNMIIGFEREFYKEDEKRVNTLGVGYDYNSIMHYSHNTFSQNKGYLSTIIAHDPNIPVGGAAALSSLDIVKTNILYNCPAVPPPRSTIYVQSSERLAIPPPVSSNCGGIYTNFSGTITSPGYPIHQGGQNCAYQIKTETGYQLRIKIVDLGISASSNCEDSYVEFYEKLDCTGYRIARVCPGNIRRTIYYSFENVGCVRYYSGKSSRNNLTGFKIDYNGDDINECFFPGICDHQCNNEPGGYYCSCPKGYFLSADGRTCFDVNECALNDSHICEYKCKNFGGYYQCICPDGSIQEKGKSCSSEDKQIPTTEQLTTQQPTTQHPTTQRPTTQRPTTQGPITQQSTTQQPTTQQPTTQRPTTQRPTTQHLTTQQPTTQHLTTQRLTTQQPTTQRPTTQQPTTQRLTTQRPTTQQPTTQRPTTQQPTTQHLTTQRPTTQQLETFIHSDILHLTSHSGSLNTPNYPETYPTNIDLKWKISCPNPNHKKITISFTSPYGIAGRLPSCTKDHLKIFNAERTFVHTFCHRILPASNTYLYNNLELEFHAGPKHDPRRKGFMLHYTCST